MCQECHVVSIETKFKSLEAIYKACCRLGWQLCIEQKTYEWVGRWFDDSPVPRSLFATEEEYQHVVSMSRKDRTKYMEKALGKCDLAIKIPGAYGEIGLIERNGEYLPIWDYYAPGLSDIKPENGMNGFVQAYATELTKQEAWKKGYWVKETKTNNKVQLTIGGINQ